jgi:hypothetical protein
MSLCAISDQSAMQQNGPLFNYFVRANRSPIELYG